MLVAQNLSRQDHGRFRIKNISFSLQKGQVMGLLGANGAGKSTLIALLSGLLAPSSGQVLIADYDLHRQPLQAKRYLGLVPEQPTLYPELRLREQLHWVAQLYQLAPAAVDRVIELFELQTQTNVLIAHLSKGWQQRLALAQAWLHQPQLLILDEPTSGLDPEQAQQLRQQLKQLSADCAILLSSHILTDIEQVCTQVLVLEAGQIVAEYDLQNSLIYRLQLQSEPDQLLDGIKSLQARGDGWYDLELEAGQEISAMITAMVQAGWSIRACIPLRFHHVVHC